MAPSQRHKTARPATTRRVTSQMHRPRFKASNVQGYSHINVQQRAPTEDQPVDQELEEEDFIRHESIQEEIEEQLLHKSTIATNQDTPTRPLTFAEATMSTKRERGGRKDSSQDATLSGPMSLESLGPFKYTFKKKKKKKNHNRWSPLDISVADSASEAGSMSEDVGVDAGSSRAVSPNPQLSFSASFPSSPQPSSSTLAVAKTNPTNSGKVQFEEEVEQEFEDIGQSHQTPTQNTFEFAAGAAKNTEYRPFKSLGAGLADDDLTTHQTPSHPKFHTAVHTTEAEGLSQLIGAEFGVRDIGAIHQTPTQNTFEFTARATIGKGKARLTEDSDLNIHNTRTAPTQVIFNFSAPVSTPDPFYVPPHSLLRGAGPNYPLDEVETATSDTDSTRDRTEAAMAAIAGAFGAGKPPKVGNDLSDSVEWDPDLPSASTPDSPESLEPIVPAPQPLAYTTVGSLVNPNAVPQFTAPNRIQREGAGRRPLLTFIPNRPSIPMRHQESPFFHPHDPSPALNMQDSMHYAQQLSYSPVRLYQGQQPTSLHSSRSTMPRQQMSLTKYEVKILKRMGGPQMVAGDVSASPATRNQTSKPFSSMLPSENRQLPGSLSPPKPLTKSHPDLTLPTLLPSDLIDDGYRRSTPLSGLEKMQTIQRLAKFENPMQELARSRLSALSVTNYLGRTVANPSGLSISSSSTSESISHKLAAAKQGSLDRGYQLPPPGLGATSMSQANPLFGAHSSSALQMPPSNRSGVPQPLTAGPPGQRQYLTSGAIKMNASLRSPDSRQLGGEMSAAAYADYWRTGAVDPANQAYLQNLNHQVHAYPNPLALKIESQPVTPPRHPRSPVYEGEIVGSKLVDSLPISAVSNYYPQGLPSSMTGPFTSLSVQAKAQMSLQTPQEKDAVRRKELIDWFHGGQREYGKTTTDHINDMAHREDVRRGGALGPIGPPPKTTIKPKIPLTADEMKNLTTAEATKPLVDALFRTLLAYADESTDSESRRHLSRFEKPDDFLIDDSEKGYASFFGEDWGAPPKRAGGSSRFQPPFHRPSATHWE